MKNFNFNIDYCFFTIGLFIFTFRSICFFTYDYDTAKRIYHSKIKILDEPFINEIRMVKVYTLVLVYNLISLYTIYNEHSKYPENNVIESCKKCILTKELILNMFNNFLWLSFNHDIKYVREYL